MLGRERPERPLQCIALVDGNGCIRHSRPVDRQGQDVGAPAAVPPVLLVAGIDHEAMEPDLEALGVSEPRELAPGEEECLLDGVLCSLDVPEDPIRDGVAAVAVQVDELGEGDLVTLPRPLDQHHLHC